MAPNLLIPHGFEANYTVGFARGLAANGVPLLVIADADSAPGLAAAGIPHRNLRGSVHPDRSAAAKAANLGRYYLLLLREIWRHRGRTIHFTGLLGPRLIWLDGFLLPLWLRLWAGRYVHTAHNTLPHNRENDLAIRAAYRWIYRFPHHFVAHTEKVADQLRSQFGVDPKRVTVISIGLNEEVPVAEVSPDEARRRLGIGIDGRMALFFGKVDPYKGADVLIEAWNEVRPGTRLYLVGECPNADYGRRIAALIAASPRRRDIEWRRGFAANAEVSLWLRACDVVVLPYRHVYQSGVIFLCRRHGVPVVATDVGGLGDFIDAQTGRLARSNDAKGVAEAVNDFFAHPAGYDRARIAALSAPLAWDRQCAALVPLYR